MDSSRASGYDGKSKLIVLAVTAFVIVGGIVGGVVSGHKRVLGSKMNMEKQGSQFLIHQMVRNIAEFSIY